MRRKWISLRWPWTGGVLCAIPESPGAAVLIVGCSAVEPGPVIGLIVDLSADLLLGVGFISSLHRCPISRLRLRDA